MNQAVAGPYFAPRGFSQDADRNVRPEFEVHPLEGVVKRESLKYVRTKDEDTGKVHFELKKALVEEPAGFMVYFARGHSIRVKTVEELGRLGLQRQPGLVDIKTLEMIPGQPVQSLAHLSQARAMASMVPSYKESELEAISAAVEPVEEVE